MTPPQQVAEPADEPQAGAHRHLHLRSPDLAARPGLRPVAPRQLGHHLPATRPRIRPPRDRRRRVSDQPKLEIHYADEWAALYVDGKLDRVGDSYLAEERAFAILGVRTVQDDAFMRGQTSRDGVAKTVEEAEEFAQEREAKRARAAELRAEADRLLREAGELA